MGRRISKFMVAVVTSAVLAACGTSDNTPDSPIPTLPPPTVSPAPSKSAERADLERQYAALQTGHAALTRIWEALGAGEQVQCSEPPDIPAPESITRSDDAQFAPLSDQLRRAAVELGRAAALWQAECSNPRPTIPPDVIDQGRLATRTAGDALREAGALLQDLGD